MKQNDMIDIAHAILKAHISSDDMIVDATMGNGHDTYFLAKIAKHVYAFDVQDIALKHTKQLLKQHQINNVTLYQKSHELITDMITDFKGVIFNLGYLPGGDHTKTTTKSSTLKALKNILPLLPQHGFVLMVVYPGHPAGLEESIALDLYLQTLNSKAFAVIQTKMPYQINQPPYILFIKKR